MDEKCGKCSGIPPCCVSFYVNQWKDVLFYSTKEWNTYKKKLESVNCGYIPCPKCLEAKHFVKIKKCRKSCKFAVRYYPKFAH